MAETYDLGANEAHVSASLGISLFVPNVGSPDDMMMQADLALYEAKRLRGGYYFHSTELDAEIRERVMIANELQTAIKNGELELYYQPQIEVTNGRIVGMEALIRWNHPKRGLTMPGAFISIAERSGVIHDLGTLGSRGILSSNSALALDRNQAPGPRDQCFGRPVQGLCFAGSAGASGHGAFCHRSERDRNRIDGIRPGRNHGGAHSRHSEPARTRSPRHDRRFWDRLLLARIPARPQGRQTKGRAAVCIESWDRSQRHGYNPGDAGAGARTRHGSHRRGCGVRPNNSPL